MKKFMTFAAFAAVALSAQAATISWGVGADVYLMETGADFGTALLATESTLAPAAGSYLALVYVGQGQDSFDIGAITQDSVVASAEYAIDTSAGGVDFDPFVTDTRTTAYADGASFGVVWFDAGSGSFDYIYSIDDGTAFNAATTVSDMIRGSANISPAEITDGWGGILTVKPSSEPPPTVPEPSVALMGLLGLGMMLKRRRA